MIEQQHTRRQRPALARFNRHLTNRVFRFIADRAPGYATVRHTGRRTRQHYRTPVGVTWRRNRLFIALNYGTGSDWVRNVQAARELRLIHRRAEVTLRDPRIAHVSGRPFLTAVVAEPPPSR